MVVGKRRIGEVLILSILVVFLVVAFSSLLPVGHGPSPSISTIRVATVSTTITSCTETALAAAITAGGTATFGVSCTPLVMNHPITILSNQTINISAGAFTVYLSGNGVTQLFIVQGGHLNLTGLLLEFGHVSALAGTGGNPGKVGSTGQDGTPGSNGASLTGQSGTPRDRRNEGQEWDGRWVG